MGSQCPCNTRLPAMQAEVAELALLLGAAIQHSQDLSARSLLQGAAHNLFQVRPLCQACSRWMLLQFGWHSAGRHLFLKEQLFGSYLVAVLYSSGLHVVPLSEMPPRLPCLPQSHSRALVMSGIPCVHSEKSIPCAGSLISHVTALALQVLAAREPGSIQDASLSTPALVLAAHEDNLTNDELSCAEARCQLLKLRRALAQYLLAEVMAGEGQLVYPARWGDAGQQALPTLLGRHPECPAPMHRQRSQLGGAAHLHCMSRGSKAWLL